MAQSSRKTVKAAPRTRLVVRSRPKPSPTSEKLGELLAAIESLKSDIALQMSRTDELSKEIHKQFAIQRLGNEWRKVPQRHYIPLALYLSEADEKTIASVRKALSRVASAIGVDITDADLPVRGSFWQRLWGATKDVVSDDIMQERLSKIERAVEVQQLRLPQAQADKTTAEAVSGLIASLKDVEEGAFMIGSILLVKKTDEKGKTSIASKTLSPAEQIALERQPALLDSPKQIFEALRVAVLPAPLRVEPKQTDDPFASLEARLNAQSFIRHDRAPTLATTKPNAEIGHRMVRLGRDDDKT